jgi:hypothetical protein
MTLEREMDTRSLRKAAEAEIGRNGYSWMGPERVIEMLDEIERLRAETRTLRNLLAEPGTVPNEAWNALPDSVRS